MFRPRIIPVLLLQGSGLVKTTQFKDPRYIGDPINTVRLFNNFAADELIVLDINATRERRTMHFDLIERIGSEAYMPFAVGGGFTTVEQMRKAIRAGAEKVILNSAAVNLELIREASQELGSQSVVASIDVKKGWFGGRVVYTVGGTKRCALPLIEYAQRLSAAGVGELIINPIDRDGMMQGYDLELIRSVTESVSLPVIALGGAGNLQDCRDAIVKGGAHAAAAGSLFIYHGARRAVLINYPSKEELQALFA